jgi:hypothetical protein
LNYREEIYHPAMADPVVTSGWFEIGTDGDLVRHQRTPDSAVTRIGEKFIFVRRDSEDGDNTTIFPIPKELAPLFSSLRSIVRHTDRKTLAAYPHELQSDTTGWKLSLNTGSTGVPDNLIHLRGCGDVLQSVELQMPNGERRRIVFTGAS